MFLNEFNQTGKQRLTRINKFLKEEFNMSMTKGFPDMEKLLKLQETAELALIQIKGSSKRFHLHPDYAKFLNLKEAAACMLKEGMYADSPAHSEMKEMINASVKDLMDSGYNIDEAASECMNRFRMDNRFAHDDDYVLPLVQNAASKYMSDNDPENDMHGRADHRLNDSVMDAIVKTTGDSFVSTSGKSAAAIVEFLNTLSEDNMEAGIQMFNHTRQAIAEDVAVEQAEVVMAVRALSDDIQDQVERIGRMMNEDMPAIADQMRKEMGAATAQQITDGIQNTLDAHLESAKATKTGLDRAVDAMSGDDIDMGMGGVGDELGGSMGEPGMDEFGDEMPMDVNEPAAAGPMDEPLGRAPVEI
jgi:hypothetical protein